MNTAYISTHKGKKGLRFVCKCGNHTYLRTNKQEYIEIDESKEVREIYNELHKQEAIDNNESRLATKSQKRREYYLRVEK